MSIIDFLDIDPVIFSSIESSTCHRLLGYRTSHLKNYAKYVHNKNL